MAGNRKKGDYYALPEVNTGEEWVSLIERTVSKLNFPSTYVLMSFFKKKKFVGFFYHGFVV